MKTEIQRYGLFVVGLLLVALPASAEGELDAARAAATQASAAYESQDYAQAVAAYTEAIEKGLDHPIVRYDLANSYYKSGDLGHAILWYERARRDAPRDRAIRHNLAQARSQMQDVEISSHVTPVLVRPVVWVRDLLSLDGWSKLLLLSVLLLCGLGVWRQWRDSAPRLLRQVSLVAVVLAVVAGAMTFHLYREYYWKKSMVVIDEEAGVHSGPGSDYALAFRVHSGLLVTVGERRDDWVRIDLGGDLVGWMRVDAAQAL